MAADGGLAPDPAAPLELETANEPILLPDGKRIYPPWLHGQPIDELALALLDMQEPAQSTFLRLIGPPGAGKSQIARAIAYRLWTGRGRDVSERHGAPFYSGALGVLCLVRSRGLERVEHDVVVVSIDRLTHVLRVAAGMGPDARSRS